MRRRRTRTAALVVSACLLVAATGCTNDTPQASTDVGGGVPDQAPTQNNVTVTTPPGAKNPNIDKWFGSQGLNQALFAPEEVSCMKDYLARNPAVADSIDISRASRDQWAINARKVQLACIPREKMGYLWADEFAATQKVVFPPAFRECVALSFATLSDDQIANFTSQVLGELGNKINERCPEAAAQPPQAVNGTTTTTR